MPGPKISRTTTAHLLLLFVVLVWGSTFVLVKAALQDVSPLLFNLMRMCLAAALLLALYRRHLRAITWPTLSVGALAGVLLAGGYQFQTAGLQHIPPARSAFLTGLIVIFVPFLSLSRHLRVPGAAPPRAGAFAGAALGFLGLALLAIPAGQPWALASLGRGDLLTLACAFCFALHLLCLAHGSRHVPFQSLAAVQITTAALLMAATLPIFEPHPVFHATPRFLLAWLVSATLATAAAFAIQSWAQAFLPASHTALILALEPVFAAATSFVVLGERLEGRALAGAALVLAAILLSELFPSGGVQPTAHEAAPLL
ncbi:DMT family transporter [Acidipila sp. EB88]|uniref:DMT family transporter n=1 Tax=Acidipila sp. EB88 TaxID=2305226 RepID=UPI000F5E3941|nr:DMT family transporter [Acidipila sp. EB88]RRA49517.1 DMT family transporter [Acidipila sp. EB88]